ncbi:MAG: PH domain-containing protein [Bifidobacterium tibiigranuli]|jgi:putative membrane protein|uniref:PH domain-containing protein n=1 Tax=Bifidobacterium tibiigranuli TaxID=2172043 RepID=UPI00235350A0|nr:PH domain-containing protein [Bifidobacterium tibiigranuli]MCH3974605.1 PH domain-containing protein [Bifidobacterium tibiigranuli]MCH4189525.1 PH domain-containing protein [Bifidobacterium tibiigranuli]MCH4204347.1 PH domain-containing protein [Bifidobacterium tibiigranuli]MCH4275394.1 PH domain-containing protein [Bifidobacterium tibiigranuli]MCI1791599.1 PH domain-containing protein [Bifidobacterium tibiigranuli]
MRRNSGFVVADKALHLLMPSCICFSGLFAMLAVAKGEWRLFAQGVICYYALTRIYSVLYEWLTIRYQFSSKGILIRKGVFHRVDTMLNWKDIRSATTSADPLLKHYQLITMELIPYSHGASSIILSAIPATEGTMIERELSLHATVSSNEDADKNGSVSSAHHVEDSSVPAIFAHDFGLKEYFTIGFTYAQFIVAVPAIYSIFQVVVLHKKYSNDGLNNLFSFMSLDVMHKAMAVCVVLLFGFIYGTVISWVRYSRFNVSAVGRGYHFQAGVFQKRTQFIPSDKIESIIIVQNLLMRLVNKYQVKVVSGGAGKEKITKVLLPLANRQTVDIFMSSFPQYRDVPHYERSSGLLMRWLLLLLVPAAAVILLFSLANAIFLMCSIIPLVIIAWAAARWIFTNFDVSDRRCIIISRRLLSCTTYYFFEQGIHSLNWGQIAVTNNAPVLLRLRYRTNMTHAITLLITAPGSVHNMNESLLCGDGRVPQQESR